MLCARASRFASRLARRGVPMVKAQRLLGHSTSQLTDQVYTHLDVEDLRDAVESLGAEPNRTEANRDARQSG